VFTAGAGPLFFEDGDLFAFATTEPKCTLSDLAAAFTALLSDNRTWGYIHVVGAPVDATALAALFDAVKAQLATFETKKRWVRGIIEAPDVSDANLVTAMSVKEGARLGVAAGYEDVTIPDSLRKFKRSAGWVKAARAACVPIYEDLARVASGAVAL